MKKDEGWSKIFKEYQAEQRQKSPGLFPAIAFAIEAHVLGIFDKSHDEWEKAGCGKGREYVYIRKRLKESFHRTASDEQIVNIYVESPQYKKPLKRSSKKES
jgi:hypothetical protein